jgi:hypothetical protein
MTIEMPKRLPKRQHGRPCASLRFRAERHARVMAEAHAAVVKAEAANAQADLSSSEALNAHLKLGIEKLRRELYGSRSERKARLLSA